MKKDTKVCVVGLGYVGLPLALLFAESGMEVTGVDCSQQVIDELNSGSKTFTEPGLAGLYEKAVETGIRFVREIPAGPAYIIAVPTPFLEDTPEMDAKYLIRAMEQVLAVCEPEALIVVESTIAPGTFDKILKPMAEQCRLRDCKDVRLAAAPERILPGHILEELRSQSRVIGADRQEDGERAAALYGRICRGEILKTDLKTAEMVKVAENAFRDVNIAYANELAVLCRKAGVDVRQVIRCANRHPRVHILEPGPGVGGHCIPVDPWFLVGSYPDETPLIRCARSVNDGMTEYVWNRLEEIMERSGVSDWSSVGFYGLTYKEDVDDTRNSPGVRMAELAKKKGKDPLFYDPYVSACPHVERLAAGMEEFLDQVKIMVILTAHSKHRDCRELLRGRIIFDTRNTEGIQADYRL